MSTQEPDNKPGDYYVTVIDGNRVGFLVGPFRNDHSGALAYVDKARDCAINADSWASFYSYGTSRVDVTESPRMGVLNESLGYRP